MTYEAIGRVSEALLDLFETTADHPELPVNPGEIELTTPADVGPDATTRIGLYPYRVRKDGSVGSMSRRTVDESVSRDPPLPVVVDYLLTTYPREDETTESGTLGQQQALGFVLQTIHDAAVLDPADVPGLDQSNEVTLSLTDQPLDELLSLWARFDATFHPSVTVEAAPVMIQSINETEFARVAERDVDVEDASDGGE